MTPRMKPVTLYMVLPAYNEAENLADLFTNLEDVFARSARAGFERAYVVVDDGSRDGTPAILKEHAARLPMTVITHDPNQGLGPTIRDGLRAACDIANDDDIIFTMDADNTHPAGLLLRMTGRVLEGNDVVIASRYRSGARVVKLAWIRRLMSFGARALFQCIYPIPGVRDYTCGYRAYRAKVLKEAFRRYGDSFVEFRGFQCMADILLKLSRLDVIFTEVPMILRYDLKAGESKMRVGVTVLATLKLIARRRFERSPLRT